MQQGQLERRKQMSGSIDHVLHAVSVTGGQGAGLDESYQLLCAGIVKQAVRDYVTVLTELFKRPTGKKRQQLELSKLEIEEFFRSDWYYTIADFDGEKLMEGARRKAVELAKEAIRRRIKKEHKKRLKDMEKGVEKDMEKGMEKKESAEEVVAEDDVDAEDVSDAADNIDAD